MRRSTGKISTDSVVDRKTGYAFNVELPFVSLGRPP